MKRAFLIAFLLVFGASALAQKPCLTKHPTWKARDCDRVAKKEMWVGMSGEMLLESQGAPLHSRKVTTAAGTTQLWVYERRTGSAFLHGECVSGCKTATVNVHLGASGRVDAIEEN